MNFQSHTAPLRHFWGAHPPRVLAIAPSRSRTFHRVITIGQEKISAGAPKSAREGACAPQIIL
jgi:hypothetical protein